MVVCCSLVKHSLLALISLKIKTYQDYEGIKKELGLFKHLFPLVIPKVPVAMLVTKKFVVILALCLVQQSASKPTTDSK